MNNTPLIQQKYKSEAQITKIILNIGISCLLMGYSNSYFSAIDYQDIVKIYEIDEYQAFYQGLITGCTPLTASFGGLVSVIMLTKFSRKNCFLTLNYINMIIVLGLLTENVNVFIFFRLIQGCISGIYTTIAPLYIKQFSPLELNSTMGTYFQMATVAGLTLSFFNSFFLSIFFSVQIYWRMVYIFPLFLLIFQTYNLWYVYPYETPKYLLSEEKIQETKQLLSVIYKHEYVDERLEQLRKMFAVSSNKQNLKTNIELKSLTKQTIDVQSRISNQFESPVKKYVAPDSDELSTPSPLKKKVSVQYHNNKLAIFAAIHIGNIQPLSGISVVIGYGAEIVKGVFPMLAGVLPIFLHLQAVIACLFAIQFLKNYGRKDLYQYGCLGCGILTLLLGYTFTKISAERTVFEGSIILISMFTYRLVYGLTIGPVAFLYIPEIIEPNIMPLVIVIYWMFGAMNMILFPIIKHYVFDDNPGPIFIFYGLFCLFSIILNHYILVQTKGKKEYEIRLQYDRKLGIQRKMN